MKTKQRENRKNFKAVLIVLALVLPMGAAADELQEKLQKDLKTLDSAKIQLAENPTGLLGRAYVAYCNYGVACDYINLAKAVDLDVPLQVEYQKQVALQQTYLEQAVPYVEAFWQVDTIDKHFRQVRETLYKALNPQSESKIEAEMVAESFALPFRLSGNTMYVPVTINGIELNMIFDTGCEGISLSSAVYQMMVKNGSITEADGLGVKTSSYADGSESECLAVNLKVLHLGGAEGATMRNVEAVVKDNPQAPLLLGRAVTEAFSKVEVDNQKQVIVFYK